MVASHAAQHAKLVCWCPDAGAGVLRMPVFHLVLAAAVPRALAPPTYLFQGGRRSVRAREGRAEADLRAVMVTGVTMLNAAPR